ncbi:hypothetical protein ACP70R_025571 [Stipagrostis hirtigluma subsp. patula]
MAGACFAFPSRRDACWRSTPWVQWKSDAAVSPVRRSTRSAGAAAVCSAVSFSRSRHTASTSSFALRPSLCFPRGPAPSATGVVLEINPTVA